MSLLDPLPNNLDQLTASPAVLRSVSSADLNQVVSEGQNKGESALFWLCLFYDDNQLLDQIPSICSKITAEGLNAIIESGPFKGYSALYALSSSSAGRDLLGLVVGFNPNIIQFATLTSQIHLPPSGFSALWYLNQFRPDILPPWLSQLPTFRPARPGILPPTLSQLPGSHSF